VIPRLHLVTDDAILAGPDFLARAKEAIGEGGGDVSLHLRGPRTSGGALFSLGSTLRPWCGRSGALLLVNDRVDVAMALGVWGAHLGRRSLPPGLARTLLGPDALVGVSAHDREEAAAATREAADFLLVGTIYPTPSHPHREPAGPILLKEVGSVAPVPLLAIGGVTPARVAELLAMGAHGVAVRGGVWDAEDPGAAVRVFLRELTGSGP